MTEFLFKLGVTLFVLACAPFTFALLFQDDQRYTRRVDNICKYLCFGSTWGGVLLCAPELLLLLWSA
jgi:hypothetical protein